MEFTKFPSIARLHRDCIITEKLDGTNAQIYWDDDMETMLIGSRKRWIVPGNDNFGFAAWATSNQEDLRKLGPGHHYGEWWGQGIQRNYDMECKVFSLFNSYRWRLDVDRPLCCEVVPVLFEGPFSDDAIEDALRDLDLFGSYAAHDFMKPEGIVVWHEAAKQSFKITLENDEVPKWVAEQRAKAGISRAAAVLQQLS